ncbi:MAG: carbonic anhydrase family protein [Bdellovibrionaceae bacterium]|nr:carbonic anhydrase family protein [Bdellovibrionales bacterium]MCB9083288.1 carbonic anhydrase family protein [Pseudobdellovibrionaceae bacterium]
MLVRKSLHSSLVSLVALSGTLLLVTGCSSSSKSQGLPEEKQITKQEPVPMEEQKDAEAQPPAANAGPGDHHEEMHPDEKSHMEHHATAHPRWGYEGVLGPQMWGDLAAEYSTCKAGDMQSPIDLKWSKPSQGRPLQFNYKPSRLKIIDNGHTIQINADQGSQLVVNGETFDLIQVHFHAQSEHTLSGKHFPMEMHFVHKSASGKLAVVGRMLKVGDKANPVIEKIWANLPKQKTMEMEAAGHAIDFSAMLPKSLTYYNYAGSLTTPPCTQGVDWNVLNTPLEISKDQLAAFRALYSNNFRPVQSLNGRKAINY